MRIIGVDPGTAITGFCILDREQKQLKLLDYGCIRTSKDLSDGERLKQISSDMKILIKKWKPTASSVEKLFFSKNTKTAISVAQARGVIMQNLEENEIPQREFTPNEIKVSVCGYGKADKKMVQSMVKNILGLNTVPKPDDAADAMAAAICLANTMEIS
ncbi:crossover junction endodeoxyribonuclease RuvC [Candidatus Peregrinibacteria bacterium]|nr:crossover junction endodeoxyribonuclease RuvC [Candidatus Peregrinibacteria bacterium]